MKLFDPEGPLLSALGTLADLMFCNILFCLFSLPLITAGASLAALYDCTLSIVERREEPFLAAQFWRAFRRNFRQGTALWCVLLAGAAVLRAYAAAVDTLSGGLAAVYRVTFLILLFLYLAGAQYVFPLQARFGGTEKPHGGGAAHGNTDPAAGTENGQPAGVLSVLKAAWYLSAVSLPQTLCALGISCGAVFLTFFLNPAAVNTAVFLWAVLLFAVTAYLQSFFFRAAFRRYG